MINMSVSKSFDETVVPNLGTQDSHEQRPQVGLAGLVRPAQILDGSRVK
jgi:hypothetical protein